MAVVGATTFGHALQRFYDGTGKWWHSKEVSEWKKKIKDTSDKVEIQNYTNRIRDEIKLVNAFHCLAFSVYCIWDRFCESCKEATMLSKYAAFMINTDNLAGKKLPPKVAMTVAAFKLVVGATEVFSKRSVFKDPLRNYSICVPKDRETSNTGEKAPLATIWEKVFKKAAQGGDWALCLSAHINYWIETEIVILTKETVNKIRVGFLGGLNSFGGLIFSAFGLWEGWCILRSGYIVRADTHQNLDSRKEEPGDGFIWKATWEDKVHSWIKVAMCIGFLVIGIYGLGAWAGFILPCKEILVVCSNVTNITAIASYYCERLMIDTLGRARTPVIAEKKKVN